MLEERDDLDSDERNKDQEEIDLNEYLGMQPDQTVDKKYLYNIGR